MTVVLLYFIANDNGKLKPVFEALGGEFDMGCSGVLKMIWQLMGNDEQTDNLKRLGYERGYARMALS